jgi:hypothetical protein
MMTGFFDYRSDPVRSASRLTFTADTAQTLFIVPRARKLEFPRKDGQGRSRTYLGVILAR